jgi:hypothetical protein
MNFCAGVGRRAFGGMMASSMVLGARNVFSMPVPPANVLKFDVHRNECTIGQHMLRFAQEGDDLVVLIDVQMRVGFGPITFFRYHHQGEERWRSGQFLSLKTQTDNNGTPLQVKASRVGDGVVVEATGSPVQHLPADALPLTHWNVACMKATLFNPQDGKILADTGVVRGREIVTLGDGKSVAAMRYSLAGKAPIDDWYDDKNVWVGAAVCACWIARSRNFRRADKFLRPTSRYRQS